MDTIAYLLGETARILRERFDRHAQAHGITRAQWLVLLTLMRNEGATQTTIAELLEVEPITLSRMIDRLEMAGHVTRTADPADRRVKRLHLTPGAREILSELRSIGASLLKEAGAGMSTTDIERFMALLRHVRSNLIEAGTRPALLEEPVKAETIDLKHFSGLI